MIKKIVIVILVLIIIASVGLAVYGIMTGSQPSDVIPKAVIVICGAAASLVRMKGKNVRRSLDFYASQYTSELKNAFAWNRGYHKKLLSAIRLYNEENFSKAVNKLIKLSQKCETKDDGYAVYMFLGLIFTDMGLYPEAIHAYEVMIDSGVADATVYNNLGYVYTVTKDSEKAISNYRQALRFDPDNAQAYHNIANLHFDAYRFDEAIEYANKALERDPNMRHSLALLAIIYSKQGNSTEADKYFHMAVSQGQDPDALKAAIKKYASLSEENWTEEKK